MYAGFSTSLTYFCSQILLRAVCESIQWTETSNSKKETQDKNYFHSEHQALIHKLQLPCSPNIMNEWTVGTFVIECSSSFSAHDLNCEHIKTRIKQQLTGHVVKILKLSLFPLYKNTS